MKTKIALLVLMLTSTLWAFGQSTVKVTGAVTDSNGEALIGVSITAKGENRGVATDIDGNYEIQVKEGTTLVYSYVGYSTAERQVNKGGGNKCNPLGISDCPQRNSRSWLRCSEKKFCNRCDITD